MVAPLQGRRSPAGRCQPGQQKSLVGLDRARDTQSQVQNLPSSIQGGGQRGRELGSGCPGESSESCHQGDKGGHRAEEQEGKGTLSCHYLTPGCPKSRAGNRGMLEQRAGSGLWTTSDVAERRGKGKQGSRESTSCAGETAPSWGEPRPGHSGEGRPVPRAGSCSGSASAMAAMAETDSPGSRQGTSMVPQPRWAATAASSTTPSRGTLSPALIPSLGLCSIPWPRGRAATRMWVAPVRASPLCGTEYRAQGCLAQGAALCQRLGSAFAPAQELQTETTFLHTLLLSAAAMPGPAWAGTAAASWAQDPSWQNAPCAAAPQRSQHCQSPALHAVPAGPELCVPLCVSLSVPDGPCLSLLDPLHPLPPSTAASSAPVCLVLPSSPGAAALHSLIWARMT